MCKAEKKKTDVFTLRNEKVRRNILTRLNNLPLDEKEPYQVMIVHKKDVRSLRQNSLYWRHIAEICRETGEDVDDCHYRLKRKYLHPIYMLGETKANRVYQINYQSLLLVKESGINFAIKDPETNKEIEFDFEKMLRQILTTTDASVKQFAEYITNYWRDQTIKGIYLTDPELYMRGDFD